MLRDNLRNAISQSGMIVKEIAIKSGVKKRTIDKWVGAEETEPKVNDLYRVCQILGITVEWAVAGEKGLDYVCQLLINNGMLVKPSAGLSQSSLDIALAAEQISDEGKQIALTQVEALIAYFPVSKGKKENLQNMKKTAAGQ